jgi:hypothetical protein
MTKTAFVGYKSQPLSVDDLVELIRTFNREDTYFFQRWSNRVSGIIQSAPTNDDFPMLEGQMFNYQHELRWKYKKHNTYEVLLLSITDNHPDFNSLDNDWLVEERNAHLYPPTETRFPKDFVFPEKGLDIKQRYFLDQKTASVHFVALTIDQ